MKRRLIVFTYPGNDSRAADCVAGAKRTLINYYRSPVGGAWTEDEIIDVDCSFGTNINYSLRILIRDTNSTCDYSIVVFIGHGCSTDGFQDIIQTSDQKAISVDELCDGLASSEEKARLRRTVVIDACRCYVPEAQLSGILNESVLSGDGKYNPDCCRRLYNKAILRQSPHVELIQSTNRSRYAYGIDHNTVFVDGVNKYVLDNVRDWEKLSMSPEGFIKANYEVIEGVRPYVCLKQIPEINTTRETSFPFFACIRPTSFDTSQEQIND